MIGPCFVGATGGSGTRVVARLMRAAGIFIGTRLNESEDAIDVCRFLNEWIPPYIASVHRDVSMTPELVTAMSSKWVRAMERHLDRGPQVGQLYGWKEPRSLYLLPFWHARYPALRYVHFVRDGRDMAFSPNQNQLRRYGDLILPPGSDTLPQPVRSIAVWSKFNCWAANYGERHMTGHYLRVRFEDLCARPAAVGAEILAFFGSYGHLGDAALSEIVTPSTIGRWRNASPEVLPALIEAGQPGLEHFGYL